MKRLKQYASAAIAAAVALVFLIVGALALTVLKPSQELASSVVASNALVMTRDGVLPLVANDVRIDARSLSGAPVALGVGTPGDVIGWIGDDEYTEVVGITSDRSVLKVEEHPGAKQAESSQSGSAAQSGAKQAESSQSGSAAQSGAQRTASASEGPQSADSSQSASLPAQALEADLEGSDMWLDKTAGQGSATLALSDIPVGRSLIAVSAAGKGDLELTLTWSMQRVNTLAIIAFLGAGLAALISAVLVLSRRHLLQRRRERAQVLTERAGADTTQTQMIDTAQVTGLIDAGRADDAPSKETRDEAPAGTEQTGEDPGEAQGAADASHDENDGPLGSADHAEEYGAAETDAGAEAAHGRHALAEGAIDADPPEKVPTDTGIIDLSAIRPGVALPSRRALREAREKGEEKIVIEGREFDTGLIPVVAKEGPAPASDDPAEGDDATSSWKSLMFGWLKKDES
ncbi:hypothetical protein [Schaalia hyovaginalis]|uniref:Uncharacterized protein n=1 Tax=Schaalia hyovaginalis TaxID=29316 RepID=A0A923IY87_9ACTO|nr:hypothetical protein [Schaalia hyovaginalis]MBB6334925.1 hypothetical protein [Schaalia hyovaginalis]